MTPAATALPRPATAPPRTTRTGGGASPPPEPL